VFDRNQGVFDALFFEQAQMFQDMRRQLSAQARIAEAVCAFGCPPAGPR
jgi:hypothetical protein